MSERKRFEGGEFWEMRFQELAEFNADNDKAKYNQKYLNKMSKLQREYNEKRLKWANERGFIVV